MWELHFGGCVRTLGYRLLDLLGSWVGVVIWGIRSPGRGWGWGMMERDAVGKVEKGGRHPLRHIYRWGLVFTWVGM